MKKTVLIIDDDVDFVGMLKEILASEECEVLVEHDGVSGLAKALEVKPAVLVVDFIMPRLSGVAMLEKLRADEWGATVPVILLTNMGASEAKNAVQANPGVTTEFLLKTDLTLDEIADHVRTQLG